MRFEDVVSLVKKPAKKVVKKAAAKKAPAKPRKTAAERRAEEMRWYRHHTSYDAFYQEAYDDDAEEARDRLEGKGYRIYDIDDCIDLKEIAAYAKSSALSEWLRCKSAEEMQAAIDSTNVPMPAAIKKQAKERIKVLQEEASRGIERPRAVMRSDVREQRRTELEESLHRRHPDLHIRDDSKMCDSYLNLRARDDAKLTEVTNIMHEMWFLFNHTNYSALQSGRCNAATVKRDEYRDQMKMTGLDRDYREFGYPNDEDWVDYQGIREGAKLEAVRQWVLTSKTDVRSRAQATLFSLALRASRFVRQVRLARRAGQSPRVLPPHDALLALIDGLINFSFEYLKKNKGGRVTMR